jgi:basic membrane protein A and related proteins
VALVSVQKAGDNGPVDDMVKALDRAKADFGVTTTFIEATDPSTYESQLRNLANSGTNIIVTTFPGMQAPLAAVAPEFPQVKFVHIFGDPDAAPVANLRRVAYEIHPGFYLGGILAATMAKSGKIGYVGGVSLPSLAANYWAYKTGAQTVNPSIQVTGAWAGSFEDPAKGLEIANTIYSDGAQVIQTDSAATSNGVLDSAKAKNTWIIKDSDPSQIALAPDRIIAVSFLKFGQSLYDEVKAALSPGWTGGPVSSGIKQDITGLALNMDFPTKTTDTEAAGRFTAAVALVTAAKAGILSGAIQVPFNTDQNLK